MPRGVWCGGGGCLYVCAGVGGGRWGGGQGGGAQLLLSVSKHGAQRPQKPRGLLGTGLTQ